MSASDAVGQAKPGPAAATGGASDLAQRLAAQRVAFHASTPLDAATRIARLDALGAAVLAHENDFVRAISDDFGNRAAAETRLLEIFPVVDEVRHARHNLRRWMRERSVLANWQVWPSRARVVYQPKGVVGIIGAWNYPLLLTLSPLVSVLAAGNHALIKTPELAPATAGLISRIIAEIYPPDYVSVVTGGAEVAAEFAGLPFDHIIFTGSSRIGKLVMAAAARNLTPVTLELGGKSPALIHPTFPMRTAAERIATAKIWNAGQTCVAPDYVLVASDARRAFVAELRGAIAQRIPSYGGDTYTRMIDRRAFERMAALITDAREKGAEIIEVNPAHESFTAERRAFPVTLIAGAGPDMKVMQEEIFGPILPIVSYERLEEAIAFINERDRPLALYYFDNDARRVRKVLAATTSGGVTVNDCAYHLVQNRLPFGGIGPSGMGAYHGFDGFAAFSHKKGVFLQNSLVGNVLGRLVAPPYGAMTDRLISFLLRRRPRA